MKKLDIGVIVTTLIIVTISCSLAFFAARVVGEPKDINLVAKNVAITFNDTSIIANGVVSPGWNTTKTFTITNNSKEEYKYNISIKDLINTFVTKGYLQYKITSTNGYNMTEFKDIPKSSVATDTILAYSVSIPVGVTQNYTIEFKYANDGSVDQSDDMGKKLSGTLFITEGTINSALYYAGYEKGTLGYQIMSDNPKRLTRTDFDTTFTETNTGTLYKATESIAGKTPKDVYYFAGDAKNNWVKFGKNAMYNDLYWRIIRTNSDGSVRLLYHGTSTTATDAYIGKSAFNETYNDSMYVGYMYGTSGSLASNRDNTNNSTIKGVIDTWYKHNLNTNYGKYISTTAVYCNDRSVPDTYDFGAYIRLETNKTPSYDCATTEDKFTVDTSTGNGKLTYPIGLMTADEVSFAGGLIATNAPTWYYKNSANGSSTGYEDWWLLSPYLWEGSDAFVFHINNNPGCLGFATVESSIVSVRPALSLKSCVKYASGDGSASDPYTIKETTSGC